MKRIIIPLLLVMAVATHAQVWKAVNGIPWGTNCMVYHEGWYIIGSHSGVYRAKDSDAVWTPVVQGIPSDTVYRLYAVGRTIVAATAKGIRTSINGATSFKAAPPSWPKPRTDSDVVARGPYVFIRQDTALWRSSDEGAHWINVMAGAPPAVIHTSQYVVERHGAVFCIGADDGIWRWLYEGDEWTRVQVTLFPNEQSPFKQLKRYLYASDNGILYAWNTFEDPLWYPDDYQPFWYESRDNGRTFRSTYTGWQPACFLDVGDALIVSTYTEGPASYWHYPHGIHYARSSYRSWTRLSTSDDFNGWAAVRLFALGSRLLVRSETGLIFWRPLPFTITGVANDADELSNSSCATIHRDIDHTTIIVHEASSQDVKVDVYDILGRYERTYPLQVGENDLPIDIRMLLRVTCGSR